MGRGRENGDVRGVGCRENWFFGVLFLGNGK